MSKIGKQPITIPSPVKSEIKDSNIQISGPLGSIERSYPNTVIVEMEGDSITVKPKANSKQAQSDWGTTRAHINNMVQGVTVGWQKQLEIEGAGYRAEVKGDMISLTVGYSHPVEVHAFAGVKFQVEKNVIKVSGPDKQAVGQVSAMIREARPPNVYTGKGIKYVGEQIRRKAGKAAKGAEEQ